MQKNPDGSVTFTSLEVQSLAKVIKACDTKITTLYNDIDFLGDGSHFRALGMWDEKLSGELYEELDYYVGDDEMGDAKNSGEWLDAYGAIPYEYKGDNGTILVRVRDD